MDNLQAQLPTFLRRRNPIPDVPEDVDYISLHLHDPNFDLDEPPTASSTAFSFNLNTIEHKDVKALSSASSFRSSDIDTESQTEVASPTSQSKLKLREAEPDYDDNSPYAEVRAVVMTTDDPSMPVGTFRAWFLGLLFVAGLSFVNQLFIFRAAPLVIGPIPVTLATMPLGRLLAWLLPRRRYSTFGYSWTLNPGPFNIKEHSLITIMANIGTVEPYILYTFTTQQKYYNQAITIGYKILLVLSTQLIPFSWAAFSRYWLVYPASMLWPQALTYCATLNTLNKVYPNTDHRHISRELCFLYIFVGGALWYFVPGFLFTGLSMFSWVCWIAPTNQIVNTLFGYSTGLGMGFLTFDWSVISFLGNPLATPWWVQVNLFAAFAIVAWGIAPILYFTNVFYGKYMPISAGIAFDNTGAPYNTSAVSTAGIFDVDSYRAYSPLFLPTTFWLSYAAQLAGFTALAVHCFLWYRHDIMRRFRRRADDDRDVHFRLMQAYPESPRWWSAIVLVIGLVFGIIAIEIFPTELPVWAFLLSLLIAAATVIPGGYMAAMTNQTIPLNFFTEFVVGYILPGKPVAMMLFKTFGYASYAQAQTVSFNLKVAHYMKLPPRTVFFAQLSATVVSSFVALGCYEFAMNNIEGICNSDQPGGYTCILAETFSTASVIFGMIGSKRIFSAGALYNPTLYALLIGAILPIPCYYLARRYPYSYWRYINIPVALFAVSFIPPATGINFSSAFTVGFIFQWYIRRKHFRWWMRYNYVIAAALDAGLFVGLLLVFFSLQLPKGGIALNWWGNTVWQNTFDAMGAPAATVVDVPFGPQTWS